MKKAILFILPVFTAYIILSLAFLDKHYFASPINYCEDLVIRSDSLGNGLFGTRRSGNRKHQGLDLFAEVGEPVLAARTGLVLRSESNKGMGNYIVLRHSSNLTTVYGHLLKSFVRKNQLVRQGDVIGLVGKTGNANYPNMQAHLHFEVRNYGIPQDPAAYLQ